ncbi:MAG: hypothetical protein HC866_25925 [Leptolyngbyaceae cyanobacterium RU_5_1]|nr:hypothetical protein [Leptolyngbyaceae cyanobacterium RU_5_1]
MVGAHHSRFFKKASKLLKYFLLNVFGFAIALILTQTLGFSYISGILLSQLGPWLLRAAVVVICIVATASMFESFRQ